jgi:prepilin-type N-terminal cleavage/methylation domain-containing protein
MNTVRNLKAFTLVELVMVIVIIGLLAAVVVPQFGDMRTQAQAAAENATASAVKSGIKLAYMTNLTKGLSTYPATLDSAAIGLASATNPLFTTVIDNGVTDGNWRKTAATRYQFVPTGGTYVYTALTGLFTRQ